jgi:site-specific recombinase XerD
LLAKAESTLNSYLYKCRDFFAWLVAHKIPLRFPVQDTVVAAFIIDKSNLSQSESSIITISAAIKWLHSLLNIESNPVDSPLLKQIVISQRKSLHKPPEQKEPLTIDHVRSIADKFANQESSLIQLRTACYVTLMFSLLFRHDEMAQLKACHITELENQAGLRIFIPRSKTDIFRDGNTTFLSCTQNTYCPVTMLRRYMHQCDIQCGEDVYVFTALSFHSSTKSYKPVKHKPLSYTRCREIFLDAMKQIGIERPQSFGLHSMRSGGATHLANKGISEELIMQHGRWKTQQAKNRYIKRDIETRLALSRSLCEK